MKVIYIAGPCRGENAWVVEQNIRRAEQVGFEVAQLGAMPLIPHTNTRFFDGTLTGEFWLEGTMELLRRCDAVVFCNGWDFSNGSLAERAEAEQLRLSCFERAWGLEALRKWIKDETK